MRRFFGKHSRVIILAGISLAIVAVLVLSAGGLFQLPFLDTVVRVVFVPAQRFAINTVQNTQRYFENMAYERRLDAEYQRLLEENKELKNMLLELDELRRENQRLLDMQNRTTEFADAEKVLGKVVAMSPGNWFSSFTIDVGSKAGIKRNDPVINADGLVGRVSEVYENYATVLTIVDGRSSVAGMIERTRYDGIVRGNLYLDEQDEACHMHYLHKQAEFQPGDRVLTSGMDGIFPKGILIGTIKGVSREQSAENLAVLSPVVNFRNVEEVLVLLNAAMDLPEELIP